ncbi:hypothetical protein GH741_16895 [Aquibacillus halophilus]|uniref:Prepilin type IV endopeptidase peptidase domain-containing protein n=1 Tax=Aquibacillus halophilus TaxID=930132 RepID=A0A6A8DF85_9BACI|nr:prepilin peptidase [Aquibacillus halophilus]MRH44323.1 hypothetical protein [Aquibacillus halophilus]
MILDILLFSMLVICVVTDLRTRKIFNKIIFPSLILALLFNAFLLGWPGLISSLLGFLTGLAILLIPYLLGGMGAGDVKLLAVVGAIKGTSFVLVTTVYMAVAGGIIAIGFLLFRKGVFKRLKSIFYSLCGIRYGLKIPVASDGLHTTIPYGVAIAGGAVMAFVLNGVILL